MAYRVERTATVEHSVRNIASGLIDDAIATLRQNDDTDQTVHHLRRNCKKLRGLMRLVRPVFADYRAESEAIRDAARILSHLRDAATLIDTYDLLLDSFKSELDRTRLAPVRRQLTLQGKALRESDDVAARFAAFERSMIAARRRAQHWRLSADGFPAMKRGIAKSYKAAKRAMSESAKDPTADAVHEWRKRVKDHWYHARLLSPMCPALMKAHRDVADDLGELLGQHHDLDVFQQRLAEAEIGDAADRATLIDLSRRRQKALEREAFPLGARLLAESASDLTRRWRSYWDVWRSEQPRKAALAS